MSTPGDTNMSQACRAAYEAVCAAERDRHEKARVAALKRGRIDFPPLPYICSWAGEEEFRQGWIEGGGK